MTITGDGHLAGLLRRDGCVVFEGAQGVLLDEWRGFHPYTTWSTTTFGNAEALLAEAGMPGEADPRRGECAASRLRSQAAIAVVKGGRETGGELRL